MFFEHSLTMNWCREFCDLKSAVIFALSDHDFRLALAMGCQFTGNLILLDIFRKFPEILAKAWKLLCS